MHVSICMISVWVSSQKPCLSVFQCLVWLKTPHQLWKLVSFEQKLQGGETASTKPQKKSNLNSTLSQWFMKYPICLLIDRIVQFPDHPITKNHSRIRLKKHYIYNLIFSSLCDNSFFHFVLWKSSLRNHRHGMVLTDMGALV